MMKVALILALASLVNGWYDDCKIDGIDPDIIGYYQNDVIKDDTDGVFKTIKRGDITEVVVKEGGYITAQIIKDEIIFSTTERFQNIEYEMQNKNSRDYKFTTDVVFTCPKGQAEVHFIQPLEDVNQHAPFFNRNNYVYRFGMPIAKGFDLTNLLDVLATDIDVTDNNLKYKMVTGEKYLKIEPKGSYTWGNLGKTRAAKIVTLDEIPSGFSHNFDIMVDDGREKNSMARVTLQID